MRTIGSKSMTVSEALLELRNKEIAYQRQESLKRRIKRARFPIVKRLSDFNYQFQPSVNRQQIDEFATMSFLNNQENIIFIGSPGVGKTHLSIGLGVEACRQGVRTLFINCHELILRLKAAQEKQHLERVMRRYERYDLLIIDELGYLPISANEAKLLFQLINGRYERKSTIITTDNWIQNYYDKLVNGEIIPQFAEAPSRLRRITINEARRIQTFPDNYVFCGAKTSVYKQIGNAVPCEIAKTIATAVITYLNSHSI